MYKIYQVELGESLNIIADKLNTTVDELKKINGIIGDLELIPGSFLIVPYVDDRYKKYTIKEGDTIELIARNNNVEANLLLRINGLNKDDFIYPNQEIIIPNNNYNYYITEENDTVLKIQDKIGKNINDILSTNDLYLVEGQMIIYK